MVFMNSCSASICPIISIERSGQKLVVEVKSFIGASKEDIVLAFHEPKMRQYADFAAV
jgi:XisI protein